VNWVFRAPVAAEELGIDTKNIATFAQTTDPSIRRFLGFEPGISDGFGLDAKWPFNVVSTIGNYSEIFERNLGPNTPLAMDRGMNKLSTNGGLMYSPPFR
jgi:general L-amino acid transport system substrate-binding protein